MKMADGDFRPAYNAQLASDCDAQVIVGVGVVTTPDQVGRRPGARHGAAGPRSSRGQAPMVEQVQGPLRPAARAREHRMRKPRAAW